MISLALLSLVSLAQADESSWSSPAPGQFQIEAYSGFPWHGVKASYAPNSEVAVTGHIETARFRRLEYRLGIQKPWSLSERWSVLTSLSVGGVNQWGAVPRQGAQLGAELTLSRSGRVEPYLSLHDRELFALEAVETQSVDGDETTWSSTQYYSRGGSLGLRVPLRQQLCLDLALQGGFIDSSFAIPSFKLGLSWRSDS